MKTVTLRVLWVTLFFFSLNLTIQAQNVGINDDGSLPDPSAMLDIQSNNKGLLIPRMTSAQRTAITSPATGLMIYQTDEISGFYYYNGTGWQAIGSGSSFFAADGNNIYNTNDGDVGIGTNTPLAKLEVKDSSFRTPLLLNGGSSGTTSLGLRFLQPNDYSFKQFSMQASQPLYSKAGLNFSYQDFEGDISAYAYLMRLQAFSDTTLQVYGSSEIFGDVHAHGARFIDPPGTPDTEIVHILSESAAYGLHVDLNAEYGDYAIAAHTTGPAGAIEGISDNGYGGYFATYGGGEALITGAGNVGIGTESPQAKLDVNGTTNVRGELQRQAKTGSANLVPIAYGVIRSNGNTSTGTGNISSTWNSTYKRYEITINSENYFWLNYITQVTPMTGGLSAQTSSVGGKLLVKLYNSSGSLVQGNFQFVTFKP
jgi:hypothetical protein